MDTTHSRTSHPQGQHLVRNLLIAASLLFATPVHSADTPEARGFRLSGFGTMAAVYNQGDKSFQRDLTQPNTFEDDWSWKADSLLGLQFDAPLANKFTATAQFVFKERAENNLAESLDWAFLRYRPNQEWMWRAGRLGLDVYLLSDYRNVSFAYLWTRPPTEFYGPMVLTDIDGADVSYSKHLEGGTLRFKLFGGRSKPVVAYSTDENLTLDFKPAWGANLSFESERWRTQLAFVRVTFNAEAAPAEELLAGLRDPSLAPAWPEAAALADDLQAKDRHLSFYSAGLEYDDTEWVIQSELGYLSSEWAALRSVASAYVSCGRRIDNITPYIMLGLARPAGDSQQVSAPAISGNPLIDALHDGAQNYANEFQIDQRTLSLGTRWDVRQDVAVKLQWDHSLIKESGPSLWFSKPNTGDGDKAVNLFSLGASFIF